MSWDLIEHFKLDAQIYGDHTLHIEHVSDPARGLRKARVERKWYKERNIGHGAFGEVWLEVQKKRGQVTAERAVKRIQKCRMESVKIDYKRELLALAKLSRYQELFVTLHGWYENNDSVFLAMEYFPHGDLDYYITRGITEDGAKMICAQLLDGLSLMHRIGFTHRDLKPQNIFIVSTEPQWWVKIGDFGISKRIAAEQTALRTHVGTQHFQAPEILGYVEEAEETSEYTNAVDMWSLGCVTYLMLAQRVPFVKPRALNEYCSGRVQFPSETLRERGVSMDGLRFVEELLNPHPSQRLATEPASRHVWLQPSLPVEVKNDKAQGREYPVQDLRPLQQTRLTKQTLEAELHVGVLEQEQFQHQPENRANNTTSSRAERASR
ncbi:uncharacterized protein Z518_02528 [Rhinocladiella mackenziei CBS 650.93]|uniref:Rhinocladiella mackenziei CBS 650.93 unplaced genomic scaffold supercont1.2, whole genome shotgun sequence n=1 Tax=Rhinocladiella mackenziei CBS 650.93 TaxID=1442369 RepID=A0A0D2IPQ3_9EURO|nr:uncharacterized protein Z518_02528 [Rhinocladiella mackenziei CBS 650.93]KIX07874.1 hypothetical protein Z518_02528 [Rhinocladiella mackenziei CBS 650.93]